MDNINLEHDSNLKSLNIDIDTIPTEDTGSITYLFKKAVSDAREKWVSSIDIRCSECKKIFPTLDLFKNHSCIIKWERDYNKNKRKELKL